MLDRWALEIVSRGDGSVEDHQRAERYLNEALSLEPAVAAHWLALGRLRDVEEQDLLARSAYRRAISLAPGEPEPHMWLGRSWKRTWIKTLSHDARDLAIAQFDSVTRLRPYGSEAWFMLVPLFYERGELGRAAQAAERALASAHGRAEVQLAAAYMSYRMGYIEWADSLFREAIPRLAPDLQALMDDPLRLLETPGTRDSALNAAAAKASPVADSTTAATHTPSLAELDPDPTTPENEAQLEVWSRIAHAYLLLSDPRRPALDARAETYIRYGPPASIELNPAGTPLYFEPISTPNGPKMEFPLDAQLWIYPELGMHVLLHDRSLAGIYTEPWTRDDPGARPDPGVLARRPDLIALGNGRGVITTLPPTAQRLEVRGGISAFESESGPRVLVQARVPAGPADTLIARWVARDAAGHEVARGEEMPAISACDPAELRFAEFTAGLPPGRYDIAVSVRDVNQRRGLFRTSVALGGNGPALALSDIVLCCGDPSELTGAVRIEADLDATVRGRRPAVVYFEIYRLKLGPDGISRFRYEYEVSRVTEERRGRTARAAERPVDRWVSRDETNMGPMRRQFIRVPVSSLAAGRYRVRVRVHDLVSDDDAERALEFARE